MLRHSHSVLHCLCYDNIMTSAVVLAAGQIIDARDYDKHMFLQHVTSYVVRLLLLVVWF